MHSRELVSILALPMKPFINIILGQKLARRVERNRVRSVFGYGLCEGGRDSTERLVPACRPAADLRVKQSSIGRQRAVQRRAFRA